MQLGEHKRNVSEFVIREEGVILSHITQSGNNVGLKPSRYLDPRNRALDPMLTRYTRPAENVVIEVFTNINYKNCVHFLFIYYLSIITLNWF